MDEHEPRVRGANAPGQRTRPLVERYETHRRLLVFHFTYGYGPHQSTGPSGYVARSLGFSRKHAAERLKRRLPEYGEMLDGDLNPVEMIHFYFNRTHPTEWNGQGTPAEVACRDHPITGETHGNCQLDVSDVPYD